MINSALLNTPSSPAPLRISSAIPALDLLLGAGWFAGDLHELLGEGIGLGELSLLLPTLAACVRGKRSVALIHPPYPPYAPAICAAGIDLARLIVIEPKSTQAACWAAEHCLREMHEGVVIVWTQETQLIPDVTLRRLRRAAQLGNSVCIALRPLRAAQQSSPASVRLRYASAAAGITVDALKLRCGHDRSQSEHAHVPLAVLAQCTQSEALLAPQMRLRLQRVGVPLLPQIPAAQFAALSAQA